MAMLSAWWLDGDSPIGFVFAGISALIVAIVLNKLFSPTLRITRHGKPLRTPPGTLPLIGNGLRFMASRQALFHWFAACERRFGRETLAITVPTLPPGVLVSDPVVLAHVFRHERLFSKGDFFRTRAWDLFGYGIINVDGQMWRAQRKAGLAFLNAANLRLLADVALVNYLEQTVDFLDKKATESHGGNSGAVVDLQDVFHELTSLLMGKMAYNMEMHTKDAFTVAFDYASGVTAERFQNPLWFLTDQFRLPFWRAIRDIRRYGHEIVEQARANETAQNDNPTDQIAQISGSLIRSLLHALPDDRKVVADAALNYLSAGRDTTAQALTWTFYLLMRNPRVCQQLRAEMRRVVAASPAGIFDARLFSPVSAPYILATFTEALRLYPPVPFEIKQVVTDTVLPDGTHLPRSAILLWCTWAMNRSRLTWGEDADDYRPERWLVNGAFEARSAHEFPSFNGGQRLCLGKQMAEAIGVRVIAVLMWRFEFVQLSSQERQSKSSLTLPMEGGLPCWVSTRPSQDSV